MVKPGSCSRLDRSRTGSSRTEVFSTTPQSGMAYPIFIDRLEEVPVGVSAVVSWTGEKDDKNRMEGTTWSLKQRRQL